jgi:ribosomal protein L21E
MKRFRSFIEDLDEAVEVRHDRHLRSHGKKARDFGYHASWAFTHKDRGDVDYNNDKEVHQVDGRFSDAKKSAQRWAKKHGYREVYVMEEVELEESIDHNQVLVKEVPNRFDSSKTTHQIMHSDKKIISSLKKNASDHAKKHLAGAYRDGSDIVHKATGKTMANIKKGTTMGDLHKQVHNYIDKNHPQKAESTVKHASNTRSIVSASDEHAANLKNKFHGKDSTVRIMKRKEGNKVYIDSKNPEHHKTVVSKLNSMHEAAELDEAINPRILVSIHRDVQSYKNMPTAEVLRQHKSTKRVHGNYSSQDAGGKMAMVSDLLRNKHGAKHTDHYFGMTKTALNKLKEEVELDESHFEVGDRVKCLDSGMSGEVVKLDKPEVGKYYTVKRDDGKLMKYAADELKLLKEDLDEAVKIGTKVRIHAPGKDYHGKVGHVGEIRKRTYGTMAPSYTVDYREPGENHNRSVTVPREKIKLHKEEVDLDEGILKPHHLDKPFSQTKKRSENTPAEYKLIGKGNDFEVYTSYRGSLKRQVHVVVRDDKIIGSGWTMPSALKDAGLKQKDVKNYSKFAQGSILNTMKEEVDLDESIGAAVKRAEASRQRALKKAAAMVKRGFSHEDAARNHDVKVDDLKKHMNENVDLDEAVIKQGSKEHLEKLRGMLDKAKPGSTDHSQIRHAISSMFGDRHIPAKHRNVKPNVYENLGGDYTIERIHKARGNADWVVIPIDSSTPEKVFATESEARSYIENIQKLEEAATSFSIQRGTKIRMGSYYGTVIGENTGSIDVRWVDGSKGTFSSDNYTLRMVTEDKYADFELQKTIIRRN